MVLNQESGLTLDERQIEACYNATNINTYTSLLELDHTNLLISERSASGSYSTHTVSYAL